MAGQLPTQAISLSGPKPKLKCAPKLIKKRGFVVAIIVYANDLVEKSSDNLTYENVSKIPYNTYGLVLGTSKYTVNGNLNPYYQNRMEAAAKLYKSGKVKYLLVSGDNRTTKYNEPEKMKASLIELGVPADRIYPDYGGRRTLDSVVRAHEIFGLDEFTIISQGFHNERAIYIAKEKGLNCVGYNAKDVDAQTSFYQTYENNLIRSTYEAAAGIFGGCDAIYLHPFDYLSKGGNDFSNELAYKQLLIMQEESYLNQFKDPTKGGYYLDEVRNEMQENAWASFLKIEEQGGFMQYYASGDLKKQIEKEAEMEQKAFDQGDKSLFNQIIYAAIPDDYQDRIITAFEEAKNLLS
ncbi:unnamed protein product, partial [Cyprideis torosa]